MPFQQKSYFAPWKQMNKIKTEKVKKRYVEADNLKILREKKN